MRIFASAVFSLFLCAISLSDANADCPTQNGIPICHAFQGGSDGQFPEAGLTSDQAGTLYGTTFGGFGGEGAPGKRCSKSCGNAYKANADGGDNTEIYSFNGDTNGAFPTDELLVVSSNQTDTFYGTTEYGPGVGCGGLGCGTAFELAGSTFKSVPFCKLQNCADGVFPHAGLVSGNDGAQYGTATFGGTGNGLLCASTLGGCGTFFMVDFEGKSIKPLYSFCSKSKCTDGAVPYGKLVADTQGNFFGTSEFGGANSAGTIFELTNANGSWTEAVLYSFCSKSGCKDGEVPEAGLTIDSAGNLYGTTTFGGGTACENNFGCGTIFKLSSPYQAANFKTLHRFQGSSTDGETPQGAMALDETTGKLFGTTLRGGGNTFCDGLGCGILFSLLSDGTGFHVLHSFGLTKSAPDGSHPEGALILSGTYVYGVTRSKGDPACRCGTIYRYQEQVLH